MTAPGRLAPEERELGPACDTPPAPAVVACIVSAARKAVFPPSLGAPATRRDDHARATDAGGKPQAVRDTPPAPAGLPFPAASSGASRPLSPLRPPAGGWATRIAEVRTSCFMPITIFDSDTIPRESPGRTGGGRQASEQALRGLDRRHAGPPGIYRGDYVIPGDGYPVRLERNGGRGDRARAGGDGRLTFAPTQVWNLANTATAHQKHV